ncbi:MAG TPA: flagellar motor switch protein FliN [Nocardioidaceae bacterium]|nr:flagellar motor switch protein FliN [Nocardioidaceae bacterium]
MTTSPSVPLATIDVDQLTRAAEAVAPLLPSGEPATPGVPVPTGAVSAADWAAAAVATADQQPGSLVGILVKADLADALAEAPSGKLDVGAALQPALDAAAAALGLSVGAGQTLVADEMAGALTAATHAVPMLAAGVPDAMLFAVADPRTVPAAGYAAQPGPARGVELLHGVSMEVTVELGRTRLSVRELLALSPGDVLELDRAAGSPADLLVNGRLIARGEVVVVDEDFALRVTEIVPAPAG